MLFFSVISKNVISYIYMLPNSSEMGSLKMNFWWNVPSVTGIVLTPVTNHQLVTGIVVKPVTNAPIAIHQQKCTNRLNTKSDWIHQQKWIQISSIHIIYYKWIQISPIHITYYKWIQISAIYIIHQICFFLDLWALIVSWWSLLKYGVLSFAKSWGLYGLSNDGISLNWLYSSSSMTFSTPTILFFPGITTYQFFFARSGT